jgi:hypothetical protein
MAPRDKTAVLNPQGGLKMNPAMNKEGIDLLDIQIEELEPKVAPDGGETVVPLSPFGKHKH